MSETKSCPECAEDVGVEDAKVRQGEGRFGDLVLCQNSAEIQPNRVADEHEELRVWSDLRPWSAHAGYCH